MADAAPSTLCSALLGELMYLMVLPWLRGAGSGAMALSATAGPSAQGRSLALIANVC